ncbi:hypothetical protein BYT27DRAFT_6453871 [Phlegmacium glaucopus]|nr:hypothetical protein BYT27DRAFT_6453871 [Phlegmacium glaucopus]
MRSNFVALGHFTNVCTCILVSWFLKLPPCKKFLSRDFLTALRRWLGNDDRRGLGR